MPGNFDNYYQTIFDVISDGVLIIDLQSQNIKYGNHKFFELNKFKYDQIIGKQLSEIFQKDKEAFKKHKNQITEIMELIKANLSTPLIQITIKEIKIENRVKLIVFCKHVTNAHPERKKYRLQSQMKKFPIPLVVYKNKNDNYQIIYQNIAMEKLCNGKITSRTGLPISTKNENKHNFKIIIHKCLTEKNIVRKNYHLIDSKKNDFYFDAVFIYTPPDMVIVQLQDITAKKKTEISLIESEKKFRSLFDLSPVGFALNRLDDGKFIEGNQALFNSIGYTEEEFRDLSYWDITPGEYEKQEQEQLKSLNEIGEYGPYTKEYIHKDGHHFPVLLKGIRSTDSKGDRFIFSIVQDMTEKHSTQKSIESLGKIIDESLNEIYIFDASTFKFLYVNKGGIQNLGFTKEELLKLTPIDIKPEFNLDSFTSKLQPLISKQSDEIVFSTQHKRKDNSVYEVEIYLQLSSYNNKNAFIAIALDITKRKQSEAQLSKLSKAVEQSPNAIFITGLNGTIEYANQKFEELNGFTKEEYLGKSPSILKSGLTPEIVYKDLWDSLTRGKDWFQDICNKRKDGSTY